jgi:hypothetical protein
MGAAQAQEASGAAQEPGLDEILENDPEWLDVNALLQKSAGSSSKEDYSFRIKKLWKVRRSPLFQEFERTAAKLGKPTRLFHGTSFARAENIVRSGFQLPRHKGMYGAGVYFADNPRKSANYAPEKSWAPFFRRWGEQGFWKAISTKSEGQVILSDVYLGSYLTKHTSHMDFDPAQDLQAGMLREMFKLGKYNSVYAPGWFISYSEYIVYEPHQAVPKYLIEFERI